MTSEHWMQTASGRRVNLEKPDADTIDIRDIAHALAHIPRFGGHCREHYSVAQHSVHVSRLVGNASRLPALMHDASEAYLGDVVRPLKSLLTGYDALEHKMKRAIEERFDLYWVGGDQLHRADVYMLAVEARVLMNGDTSDWGLPDTTPNDIIEKLWPAELARTRFLERFEELDRVRRGLPRRGEAPA